MKNKELSYGNDGGRDMSVMFSSTWVDGKIYDIDNFISKNSDRSFLFVLDTNFAIYAREYVTNPDTFNEKYPDIYRDFLETVETIKKLDSIIVYHFACEEASRSKHSGKFSKGKYKLMVDCISILFDLRLNNEIRSSDFSIKDSITTTKVPLLRSNGLFKSESAITYASILKAFILKNYDTTLDSKERIRKYINFLDQELDVYSPMMVSFGIHYFGTDPNILKNVKTKIGFIEVLNKIYAASIDLMMPTTVTQLAEYMSGNVAPIFVTFDKGVKLIFDSLYLEKFIKLPEHGYLPAYSFKVFYTSGWNDKEIIEFSSWSDELHGNRLKNGIQADLDHNRVFALCTELEKDLLSRMNGF